MKVMKILSTMIIVLAGATQFVGCGSDDAKENYTTENWQTFPKNSSESVDVFFLHPTTYFSTTINGSEYSASWNQTFEEAKADLRIPNQVASKSSVFHKAGTNIYAPYYRQAAGIDVLNALLWKTKEENSVAAIEALEVAYSDVEKAFDLYIDKYNKDANGNPRPFILAGHSQGSNLLLMLLERKFSDPALREQLVAAYVIGWSITADDMSNYSALRELGICSSKEQTGCIVTYNTQGYSGSFDFSQGKIGIVQENSYSVNPLTWVASSPNENEPEYTPNTTNLGALFYEFQSPSNPQLGPSLVDTNDGSNDAKEVVNWENNLIGDINISSKKIANYTGAGNVNGALVIEASDLPAPGNWQNLNFPYNQVNSWYHGYDYSFFFFNLEQNVIDRITSYNANK